MSAQTQLWEPQPSLAWAGCHGIGPDGRMCQERAAGFRTSETTGPSTAGLSMCEKHGNPEANVQRE